MAGKKGISNDMAEELRKFNHDLEKHLPQLNVDFLKDKNFFKDGNQNDEYMVLLTNNLMDLKTEIALIRRNLVDSVEGMVLRVLNTQKVQFAEQMNNFYGQFIMEIKGNFSTYITEINEELSEIRKGFSKVTISNENISSKIENFNAEFLEFKSLMADLKAFKRDSKSMMESNFNKFGDELDVVNNKLANLNDNKVEAVERLVSVVREMMERFEAASAVIETRSISLNKTEKEVTRKVSDIAESMAKFEAHLGKINDLGKTQEVLSRSLVGLSERVSRVSDSLKDISSGEFEINTKLAMVDEHIAKLDESLAGVDKKEADVKEKLSSIKGYVSKLDGSFKALDDKELALKQRLEDVDKHISKFDGSLKSLEEISGKGSDVKQKMSDVESYMSKLDDSLKSVSQKEFEMQEKLAKLDEHMSRFDGTVESLSELRDREVSVERGVSGLSEKISKMDGEIVNVKNEGSNLKSKLLDVDSSIAKIGGSVESIKNAKPVGVERVVVRDRVVRVPVETTNIVKGINPKVKSVEIDEVEKEVVKAKPKVSQRFSEKEKKLLDIEARLKRLDGLK